MEFRGGLNELMRQVARVQRKIDQTKKDLEHREVTASAVGDKVRATVTWGRKVQRIEIDAEFLQNEGLDMALDAACAAINNAIELADKAMGDEIAKVTGGAKLPGIV